MSGGVSYTFHIGEAAVLPGGLGRSSSFSLGNHLYEWNCEMCQARKPRVPQFVKWNVILIGWAIFFNETNTDLEVFVVLKCSRNHNRWLHHTVEKHRKKNRWTKNRFFLHDVHWIYTFLKSNCYNIPFRNNPYEIYQPGLACVFRGYFRRFPMFSNSDCQKEVSLKIADSPGEQ